MLPQLWIIFEELVHDCRKKSVKHIPPPPSSTRWGFIAMILFVYEEYTCKMKVWKIITNMLAI